MTLTEWIKANVKDGVDVTEAEKLVADLNPLKDVKTADDALAFIKRNEVLVKALDAETARRVESHDKKYQEEKLPGLLEAEREKIRKELAPEETEEQKRIRALEEENKKMRDDQAKGQRKAKLRELAKESGFDPDLAEDFAVYGDDAEKYIEKHKKAAERRLEEQLSEELKKRGAAGHPRGGDVTPQNKREELIQSYNELEKSNDPNKGAKLIALKGQIERLPKE